MSDESDIPEETAGEEDSTATGTTSSEPKGRVRRLLVVFVVLLVVAGALFVRFRDQLNEDWERWESLQHYDLGPEPPPDIVILREGDKTLLWGTHEGHHFDITDFRLDSSRLSPAFGRDAYPPLLDLNFVSVQEAAESGWLEPHNWAIIVAAGDAIKVYPIPFYNVINDVAGDTPIAVIDSCVFERQYGDITLTLAHTGYTSHEIQESGYRRVADLLWDLETESLWSPLLGKSAAGPCIDIPLKTLDQKLWAQMQWENVIERYPDAMVLDPSREAPEQFDMKTQSDPPWPDLNPPDVERLASEQLGEIAPDWGENLELGTAPAAEAVEVDQQQ